jgi:hypothetical protein
MMHWKLATTLFIFLLPANGLGGPPSEQRRVKAGPKAQHANRRSQSVRARCKDIFCTTQVVRMDGQGEQSGLSPEDIERTINEHRQRIDPCLIQIRRRDPTISKVRLEFVVTGKGAVLASRIDGKRGSPLARCVHKALRTVQFPRFSQKRTVAAMTLAVPQ